MLQQTAAVYTFNFKIGFFQPLLEDKVFRIEITLLVKLNLRQS